MRKMPSLTLLAGFEAAARHGNFSRAADELHVSQSAISHQVQQLEEQLRQPLFRRVGRGVELNVAGEVLLQSVLRSMTVLRSGLAKIETYLNPGLVVLVCPEHIVQGWLQHRLPELEAAFPELCLLISTDISARFVDEVDVDINISDRPLAQSGLTELRWAEEDWVVVASNKLANSLLHIPAEQHCLHTELICLEQSLSNEVTEALYLHHLTSFRKRTIYDDARLLLDSVLRGRGIGCVPHMLASEALENNQLQILPHYPQTQTSTWWITAMVKNPRADIVAQVFNWLISQPK